MLIGFDAVLSDLEREASDRRQAEAELARVRQEMGE